jgi:hypothetical protein
MARYCPNGDGVFEDWIERCPHCGRTLAPEAPVAQAPATPDDPVVFLATLPNEPMARLTAQVLEDEGIRTLVRPRGPGFGAWGSVATFEHDLHVLGSHLEAARQILAELESAESAEGDPWSDVDPEDL